MNLATWIERAAAAGPGRPALALGHTVVADYAELARRVRALAAALRDRFGLSAGDRVAILAANCPSYIEVLFAAWRAGLIIVPINARLHPVEVAFIVEHSGAAVTFVDGAHAATAAAAGAERIVVLDGDDYASLTEGGGAELVDCDGDHPAWLFYTSGTTGRPKGATLSHRNLQAMTLGYLADVDRIDLPASGGFDPAEIVALWERWRRVVMFAAPTMVKRLVRHLRAVDQTPPEGLKLIVYGGGPMYVQDVLEALETLGPKLAQIYGQGESPMTITTLSQGDIADQSHPRHVELMASAGRPFSHVELRIIGPDGSPSPIGEVGEVAVRGDPVMLGYWRDPEATAATVRDGWLHTGDVGRLDEAGYLTLLDRANDLIISGGSNIYPREVEEVLLTHPAVEEVSVFGRPDPEWGEVVVAYVVGSATPAELDAHCLARIARFKRPRDYIACDALPKNSNGKILKTELRSRDRRRPGGGDDGG
jgi:long-chain acyl-CoA synthetase